MGTPEMERCNIPEVLWKSLKKRSASLIHVIDFRCNLFNIKLPPCDFWTGTLQKVSCYSYLDPITRF